MQLLPIITSVALQFDTLFETTQPQRHTINFDNTKSREITTPPFMYSTARNGRLDSRRGGWRMHWCKNEVTYLNVPTYYLSLNHYPKFAVTFRKLLFTTKNRNTTQPNCDPNLQGEQTIGQELRGYQRRTPIGYS
jgi:hypothetical protein